MDALSALPAAADTGQSLSQNRLNAVKNRVSEKDAARIDKVATDFEAVFLAQMMEQMFADVDLSPGFDGPGEDVYKSLMLDEYGKVIAKAGGIGVADHIRREMLQLQEIH